MLRFTVWRVVVIVVVSRLCRTFHVSECCVCVYGSEYTLWKKQTNERTQCQLRNSLYDAVRSATATAKHVCLFVCVCARIRWSQKKRIASRYLRALPRLYWVALNDVVDVCMLVHKLTYTCIACTTHSILSTIVHIVQNAMNMCWRGHTIYSMYYDVYVEQQRQKYDQQQQ